MNKLSVITGAVVVVLGIVLILDHVHVSAQLRAVHETLETLDRRLDSGIAVAATPTDDRTGDPPAEPPRPRELVVENGRDGLPRLGENFLLPYETPFVPAYLDGTLSVYGFTPKGLNSILENATTNSAIDALINDNLCVRDTRDPKRWMAHLATSCVISDDFKVYTFAIRPGVYWHVPPLAAETGYEWLEERVELTAEDFAFTVEIIKNEQVDCPQLRNYYEKLERAEALDRHTLRLTWSEKLYTNLSASLGLDPLPRHVYAVDEHGRPLPPARVGSVFSAQEGHWFDRAHQHVGVGPYTLVNYQPDVELIFARNPDYWGGTMHFKRVAWRLQVKDPGPMLTAFKNGYVQTYGLRANQYLTEILQGGEPRFAAPDPEHPHAGRKGELAWEKVKARSYSYVGWNMRRPPFDDRRVRQAMSHAFPRERLIDDVYHGLGQPLNTNVHPDSEYANTGLPAYAFDLAAAARLLGEAGWTDTDDDGWLDKEIDGERRPFRFEAKIYANSKEWERVMDIYANTLAGIGVDMEVKALEWKDLLKVYESKDFDAVSGGWRMDYEVDFKQLWHSSAADEPRGSNHCGFKDERADELAEELRRTFDLEERKRIAFEFQEIIHAAQPYTFFRASEGIFAWQNRPAPGRRALGGVIPALDALHPFYSRDNDYWYFRE